MTLSIQKSAAGGGFVSLKVYDVLGGEVAALVNEVKQPGKYTVEWNPSTSSGQGFASGVCFYRLTANKFADIKENADAVGKKKDAGAV